MLRPISSTISLSCSLLLKSRSFAPRTLSLPLSMASSPSFTIDKSTSLVDEPVRITVTGLPSNAPVTVRLAIHETYGGFAAFGHFAADSNGNLCIGTCPSTGGTYSGLDGMGLFWSLQQLPGQKPGLRLLRREAEVPLKYRVDAFHGHVTWEHLTAAEAVGKPHQLVPLCGADLCRTYLHPGVERIPVRFGRIRGSLFKPRSLTSCPPVIDLFGTGGGLMEHRAALLAKEGFSVLSLAYFNYQDLPKTLSEFDMDYFEEAIDYMLESPYCCQGNNGVGIVGVSAGADIVANCAILFGHKVRSAVWINGAHCRSTFPVRYRGRLMPDLFPIQVDKIGPSPRPPGLSFRDASCVGCSQEQMLPVELATCRFLFLSCLDDFSTDPQSGAKLADRLKRAGKSDYCHVTYDGAGHLLEPPISPCTGLCYHGVFGIIVDYGGEPLPHHQAQVDSWRRIIEAMRVGSTMAGKL